MHAVVSALPTGTAYSRYVMTLAAARGDSMAAALIAERFRDSPQVKATLELATKAAVSPGATSDATWAGALSVHGIAHEALALERGISIIGQLAPKMRRVPFRTDVPRETGTGTGGAWIGENGSTPAAKSTYETLKQENYKAAALVVLTKELLKLGDPGAEKTVRETVAAGVSAFLDGQFLTPSVTLSAGLRPASITNGATAITPSGTSAPSIAFDLAAMLSAISTSGAGLTWIMRPTTAYHIAAKLGASAAGDVPKSLFGIPMILSANSPQQITLVDASNIIFSDDDGIDIASSDQASIILNDAPGTVVQTAGAAPIHTSLWQNGLWSVRVTRWLAYLRAQTGAVSYMLTSY